MFESLIEFDAKLGIHPKLAVTWQVVDSLTGSSSCAPTSASMMARRSPVMMSAFSLKRARDVPNSPGPLASFVRPVKETEVIDKLTIRIHRPSRPHC